MKHQDGEDVAVRIVTPVEVDELIRSGEISGAQTISAWAPCEPFNRR